MNISIFPNCEPGKEWESINASVVETDLESIGKYIEQFAWSPAIFKQNKRNENNFLYADFIALDIDDGLSIDDAVNRCMDLNLKCLVMTSKSHKLLKNGVNCDRFRLIFQLKNRIEDKDIYKSTWIYLSKLFPETDKQTGNADRFYHLSKTYKLLDGDLIEPQSKIEKKVVKSEMPLNINSLKLRENAMYFILNAHTGLPGEFNVRLNKAVFELGRSGLSKEQAMNIIQNAIPNSLDAGDLRTFNSAWKAAEAKGPYPVKKNSDKNKISDEEIFEILNEELLNKFYVYEDEQGGRALLLQNIGNKNVKKIKKDTLIHEVGNLLKDKFNYFYSTKVVEKHVDNWILYCESIKEYPKAFSFKDSNDISFNKMDFNPKKLDTPTFDEFINRCSNKEAMMAYIWSIFQPDSDRQQYLWICGEGNDGKSSLLRFLEKCLKGAVATEQTERAYTSDYFNASFVGKRLALFSDTNSRAFIQSGQFKQLTGGDTVLINQKWEQTYSTKLDVKFIFLSNNYPNLSSKKADLRRIILCEVKKFDETKQLSEQVYNEMLWKEREGILHKCKLMYDKIVDPSGIIKCELDSVKILADESEIKFISIMKKFFVIEDSKELTGVELYDTLKIAGLSKKNEQAEFREYLFRKFEITKARTNGGVMYKGVGKK